MLHTRVIILLSVLTGTLFVPAAALAESTPRLAIVFPIVAPKLSSNYGMRRHPIFKSVRHHNGVDLQAPENSHVRAVLAGRVIFADTYAGYGKLVTIQHEGGYSSLYGHLSEIRINPGARVQAGGIIGRVGSSGAATGPHLHFEWRLHGKPLDPLRAFPSLAAQAEG